MSRLKKVKFKQNAQIKMSNKDLNYKEVADNFLKKMKIKSVDKKDIDSYNRFYKEWINYIKKYYPEWMMYPVYIWRGWGYLTGPIINNPNDDEQDSDNSSDIPSEMVNPIFVDMGGGDGGGE